jgi:magnesium transporter
MEVEEANEVRELLGFEENTAGGFMTTEYIELPESTTVESAVDALRGFTGPLENIHFIFLIAEDRILTKVVPLARLIVADRNAPLTSLVEEPVISVPFHADEKTVVSMFHKYNLLTLPVVDDNGRLLGVVTADDVLELVIKEK